MIHTLNSLLVATVLASSSVSVTSNDYARQRVYEEFGNDSVMLCIIEHESHFKQYNEDGTILTHFNRNKSFDTGITQVNSLAWQNTLKEIHGLDANNIDDNIAGAKIILKKQGYSAWSTYEKYCK